MRTLLALSIAMLGPVAGAAACSIPPPPMFRDALPKATYVFVFRLDSTWLQSDPKTGKPITNRVFGRISTVRAFRGKPIYRYISFSTAWCGGNRLDVGNLFITATSQPGKVLKLAPGDETVIDITHNTRDRRIDLYSSVMRGVLPKGFPERWESNYTLTFGYPPKQ